MSRLSFDFGGLPGNFWDVHTATDEIPFISRLPILSFPDSLSGRFSALPGVCFFTFSSFFLTEFLIHK